MQICYSGLKKKINGQIAKYMFLFGYVIICVVNSHYVLVSSLIRLRCVTLYTNIPASVQI